jgi:hypothetical protein
MGNHIAPTAFDPNDSLQPTKPYNIGRLTGPWGYRPEPWNHQDLKPFKGAARIRLLLENPLKTRRLIGWESLEDLYQMKDFRKNGGHGRFNRLERFKQAPPAEIR